MRYAAYIRYSHQDQAANYSLDAQKRIIEEYVKNQGGRLIEIYVDEAETGRTINNRADFLRMRQDAHKKQFDALVVAKFDRLNRNRIDAIAMKSLLRRELGIKVVSATEPSEHDGAVGALVEGILECVAEWFSLNLSQEFKKGKRERALQGLHNNQAPFGYDKDENGVLVKNDYEREGLMLVFELYATGNYSMVKIAQELNQRGYRNKQGGIIGSEMVRDMIRNRTYLGYVKYQPYAQHSDCRRSKGEPVEWHKGQHEAIVPVDLFMRCEEKRQKRKKEHEYQPVHRDYLLRDLVYCWNCSQNAPDKLEYKDHGKMRSQTNNEVYAYYRCRSKEFARLCPQKGVRSDIIEKQVIDVLLSLKPSGEWREQMIQVLAEIIQNKRIELRMNDIKAIIERMDFRWDYGFITDKDAYLEQRTQLQQEIDELTPIFHDEMRRATDIVDNFALHWKAREGDKKAEYDLIHLLVERVYVNDEMVVGIVLRPNHFIASG